MICLSDNDILLHFSAWNLLREFQAFLQDTLKTTPAEIYVMNAFTSCLRSADTRTGKQYRRWLDQYGQGALDRALRFCESVNQVNDLPYDRSVVVALQTTDDIDAGEAILIAVAHYHPGSLILTNELRFLTALATAPECSAYHAALQKRIVHLRQAILFCLNTKGHKYIERCVRSQPMSDRYIYNAFGKNASLARIEIQEGIQEAERMGDGLLHSVSDF